MLSNDDGKTPTFTDVRAKVIRLHMPHDTPPRLVSIDVQRIQVLAVIAQRGELLRCIGQGGLDAEVEEPGVDVGGWGVGEDVGEDLGDEGMHD